MSKTKTVASDVTNHGASAPEKKKAATGSWLWALKWVALILLSPIIIPLYYLPKGIWWMLKKGGKRIVWDEFLSYIKGHVARYEDGTVKYIRFVVYDNTVHFHYCIWGSIVTGLVAMMSPEANAVVAPILILLPIACWVIVKWDFPFDKIWKPVLLSLILVPLADYGLYKGTEIITSSAYPWLEQNAAWLGITGEMAGGYELVWFTKWAFARFGFEASPGVHFFAALAWSVFFLGTVSTAWFNRRFELDRRDLYRRKLFKSAGRQPVYMRGINVVVKDVVEVFPFGFASLIIEIKGRPVTFANIAGLAWRNWLGGAMEELINTTSDSHQQEQKKGKGSGGGREDEAELVDEFQKEMAATGHHDHDDHDDHEVDELGDDQVAADIGADEFDDADFDGDLDVDADL